jgi:hypothetical protein
MADGGYVKYGDISAVISAGGQLRMAGDNVASTLAGLVGGATTCPGGSIKAQESATLKGNDDYSKSFNETYRKPGGPNGLPRNDALMQNARDFVKPAQDIGTGVVKTATTLLYVDAVNGMSMTKALNDTGTNKK